MIDKINQLKEAFRNAKSESERKIVDIHMKELIEKDAEMFSNAMLESAKETAARATQLALKQRVKEVSPAI